MKLAFKAAAEDDLERIHAFNLARSLAWADRVEARLLERCQALIHAPRSGPPLPRAQTRRLSITDIQYVIDYELSDDAIVVARIQHSKEIR